MAEHGATVSGDSDEVRTSVVNPLVRRHDDLEKVASTERVGGLRSLRQQRARVARTLVGPPHILTVLRAPQVS